MAITSSMGLARAVQDHLEALQIEDPLTKNIHIKISGCPNGCARHHLANIGFYGAALKFDKHQVPGYIIMLGGNYDDGRPRIAQRLDVRVPAKRIPDATERFLHHYQANRREGEVFNDFVDRVGLEEFEALIKDLSVAVKFDDEHQQEFVDWNRSGLYKLERGEGECAA